MKMSSDAKIVLGFGLLGQSLIGFFLFSVAILVWAEDPILAFGNSSLLIFLIGLGLMVLSLGWGFILALIPTTRKSSRPRKASLTSARGAAPCSKAQTRN